MKRGWRILGVALAWRMIACGNTAPTQWIVPDYNAVIAFENDDSRSKLLWKSTAGNLWLKEPFDIRDGRSPILKNNLVMVTIDRHSRLADEVASASSTIAYKAPVNNQHGFALVKVSNQEDLNRLALAAHRSGSAVHEFSCGRLELLDLTEWTEPATFTPALYAESIELSAVKSLLAKLTPAAISNHIKTLEDLGTRHHATAEGKSATATTRALFEAAIGDEVAVEYREVDHRSYYATQQKSLVVAFPGQTDDTTTVILGAHLDSINQTGTDQPAPGADDNASGIATLVELARLIASTHAHFSRRLELHAYAAEEVGLIGSGDIAAQYAKSGRNVAAMLQLDMTAYSAEPDDDTVYLVKNDTSASLRRSLKDLLTTYLDGGFKELSLATGASSDHRSWTRRGFSAVFPFEHPLHYNRSLHTADDTSDTINNLTLSTRIAKATLAFAAHYAGLSSAKTNYSQTYAAQKKALASDLKLAITAAPTHSNLYLVGVGAPNTVAAVELCTISAAGTMACNAERLLTQVNHQAQARTVFVTSSPLALAATARLAIFGYDQNDQLIAVRTVQLKAK